jgi:DNA-binding transcriptional MocR family regulator
MENNINKGFIKLQREILEWEWYHDNNTFRLMIHLLLKSNYMLKKWQGNTINPGELITSIGNLSKELKLSENVIRTSLKKLKKTDYIHSQSTNKFTKIILLNSVIYEGLTNTNNNQKPDQKTNQTQSNHTPLTTTKKVKKEKEIIESKEVFKTKIFQLQKKFSLEILNSFYNYWTEENEQTGRLKFENEEYFNFETRLSNWKQFPTTKSKKEPNNFYLNR